MINELVTLAIHTNEKAKILKSILEENNIEVQIDSVDKGEHNSVSAGVRVRIKDSDLPKALGIVESLNLFSYSDEKTVRIDDGKKRILVPIDFSDYSDKALEVAFNMAKEIDAKLKILHVFYNPYYPSALPMAQAFDYDAEGVDNNKNILDKVRAKMLDFCTLIDKRMSTGELPTVNYSYSIREGVAEEEIVEYSEDYRPTLIVMGTKGKSKNDNTPFGSVTAEVIEMTRTPVFAIPVDTHITDSDSVKHISFLTNFTQRDLISFDFLVNVLKPYHLNISLTHINVVNKKGDKWSESDIQRIRDYLKKQYPDLNIGYKLIDADDMLEALVNHIEEDKVDILTLNTSKRNIFARMFMPSISRKMIYKSSVALLILRGKPERS